MRGYELREYQKRAVREIVANWRKGRVVELVAPTRSGKTAICLDATNDGRRVLVVTPRIEIAKQWARAARDIGKTASVVGGGEIDYTGQVVCSTIDSCRNHVEAIVASGDFGYLVFDEAHRAMSYSGQHIFDTFLRTCRTGKALLTTATPGRSDEWRLEFLADTPVVIVTHEEAILAGALTTGRVVEVRGAEVLDNTKSIQRLLNVWQGECRRLDVPTVFFVDRIAHIEGVVNEARRRGVRAAGISGKTPAGQRKRILADYDSGAITMLVNVNVLTEGIDINQTACVVLASQPATRTPLIQRTGRALGARADKRPVIIINRPRGEVSLSQTPVIEERWPRQNARRGLWRPYEVMERVEADRKAGINETTIRF